MTEINPEILTWARKTAGYDIDEAAQKLGIKDGKTTSASQILRAYENGEKTPSRTLLSKMVSKYRRPLLTFYLKRVPEAGDHGEDFRSLPENIDATENAIVDAIIRDVKVRQSIIKEALIDEEEDTKLGFVGAFKVDDDIQKVATHIVKTIKFDIDQFRKQRNADEAFNYLRETVEASGIFILLISNLGSWHTNIDTNVFRGFALADDIAPFIVINDQDTRNAWSFTILHELVHIWLGKTGVSGSIYEKKVEKFCNDVASEILLPARDIQKIVFKEKEYGYLKTIISDTAEKFNLSKIHLCYRLYREGRISKELWSQVDADFQNEWRQFKREKKDKNKEIDGGPNYYIVRRHKLGNNLIHLTERMLQEGTITVTKAATVFGVKPLKVHRLLEANGTSKAS